MERQQKSGSPEEAAERTPRRRPESRRAHKVALTIAQQIVDDITEGDLGPGTKLASERDMLERFSAGRGTLRESLRFLEMSGAIAVKAGPQGGPIVGAPDGEDLARVLGLFLQLRKVPFKAIVDAREILEPELAGLAAERRSEEQAAEIEDSIEGMRAFLDDERNFLAENDHFHAAVASAAGNELFGLLIASMHTITDGVPLGLSYETSRRESVLRSHAEIYEAIRAKDAEGARWAMRKHMRRFTARVSTDFPAAYEKPLRWRDLAP
ncbi:MAG: FadR family transcriptional regulator [Pseudonocardia sp.]|uniref:FadR/GntR family transcriptional regulator n=1 Tax=unclassified Pseudonocardia TaxID=2619320 RepID=UPI000A49C4E2|nr:MULTISPECIES: FCD domain-containing protein [unclassified Pseudonocardia]MBN9110204.1 FadR family transcriptional regulator [Pseudonocardia sp.]